MLARSSKPPHLRTSSAVSAAAWARCLLWSTGWKETRLGVLWLPGFSATATTRTYTANGGPVVHDSCLLCFDGLLWNQTIVIREFKRVSEYRDWSKVQLDKENECSGLNGNVDVVSTLRSVQISSAYCAVLACIGSLWQKRCRIAAICITSIKLISRGILSLCSVCPWFRLLSFFSRTILSFVLDRLSGQNLDRLELT